MSKYSDTAVATFKLLLIALLGGTGGVLYDAYNYSIKPSKFELAADELGFNKNQQEALLKIFHLAGYFEPNKLWHDILAFDKTNHSKEIFTSISYSLKSAGANQQNLQEFNPKLLRKNLFKNTDKLDVKDVKARILYVAQNAFNRTQGQERNELTSAKWMEENKDLYLDAAKTLNLIDEVSPQQQQYDQGWIAGASRIGVLARLIYYKKLLQQVHVETTKILAGERPLWANLDGIDPTEYQKLLNANKEDLDITNLNIFLPVGDNNNRIEEGKEYMLYLAKAYNIELNSAEPFIEYKTKEECPKGLFPGRIYPNYANSNEPKLTESLMCKDLLNKFLTGEATIIDTKSENNQRPNTSSTASDAAREFIAKIENGNFGDKKDYNILFVTNNPYIERQTLATQREVNKILKEHHPDYKINIEGVGFPNKQDVPTIHSELAALVAEKYKDGTESDVNFQHPINELLYQTRSHQVLDDPLPLIGEGSSTMIQNFVDHYTD